MRVNISLHDVYSSLYWCTICKDYVIMEYAVHLNMESSQNWNVAKCTAMHKLTAHYKQGTWYSEGYCSKVIQLKM